MTSGPVVVDRVVLPAAGAADWVTRLRSELEPGVLDRGGPPAEVRWTAGDRPGTVTVECVWTFPDLAAFWRGRSDAADPAVCSWWAATDRLAHRRERRVLAPDPLPSSPDPPGPGPRPAGVRAVVVGRPVGDPVRAVAGLADLAGVPDAPPGLRASHAGLHLPGVVAPPGLGADACTWDLLLDAPDRLDEVLGHPAVRALVTPTARVVLDPLAAHAEDTVAGTVVKRTLLLRTRPDARPEAVAALEADLVTMPGHIAAIRSWSLARVVGHDAWTHVWEQEFTDVRGLTDDYMRHPFHWAVVDGWFDARNPDHVVEPVLAHLSCVRPPSLGALCRGGPPT